MSKSNLNRRTFLKLSTASTVGVALTGMTHYSIAGETTSIPIGKKTLELLNDDSTVKTLMKLVTSPNLREKVKNNDSETLTKLSINSSNKLDIIELTEHLDDRLKSFNPLVASAIQSTEKKHHSETKWDSSGRGSSKESKSSTGTQRGFSQINKGHGLSLEDIIRYELSSLVYPSQPLISEPLMKHIKSLNSDFKTFTEPQQ